MPQNKLRKILFLTAISVLSIGFAYFRAEANIIDALKEKIQSRSAEVEKLKTEINQYQKELETTNIKARSLTQDIQTLNTTKKKLDGDISSTEKNIDHTTATIAELEQEIKAKEEKIIQNKFFPKMTSIYISIRK